MNRMQAYYDKNYHSDYRKELLLSEYSLRERLVFFQKNCISKNDRVLDFGCGPGAILTGLRDINVNESAGIDISENAIDFVKNRFPDYKWIKVGIDDPIPYADEYFDVVISSEVIEHVFDVDNFLAELRRVIKPGGVLALSCPHHGFIKDLTMLLSGRFEDHYHNPYDPHLRYYSRKSMSIVLNKNRFHIDKIQRISPYFYFKPFSRIMVVKAHKL
jgi:2-polyprenyl-3-methyl-5-hydroxy-6-metoxy-1,4-benzoquinol methylase